MDSATYQCCHFSVVRTLLASRPVQVDKAVVAPHVPRLLRALLSCFRDPTWPVRDAACTACGRCAQAFPQDCREVS